MTGRPRGTSRTPASRPRRLAGQGGTGTVTRAPRIEEPRAEEPHAERRPGLFAGSRITRVLVTTVVVLVVLTAAMALYLVVTDDEPSAAATPPVEGAIAVPEDRPILLPWADAQRAAAAAAEAATTIVTTSWQQYDEKVEEATALMTPSFAEEFRATKDEVRAGVVDGKVDVDARVVAQSVVRANTSEVQALVFLNQYTTRDGGETTYSPYRALVTVVNTDAGWLVSDLQTR
ncbi:MAG TPA: hypothetical protein VMF51_07295 [Nocardioides sp.]|uniref:hypothetical protein n=1 Tax=Nocardioides sp. TaxID=35761 RepID=UPI002CC03014|nr:hypothetical protein [Nocardioides sp.]HTW14916.1 hypothetical protein [Nocardioides sp.]